jgi:phage baseplate assembly protein W|tara:strand:+ start:1271 stop:1654 length:384 start_codon:yes stop_codon:yes gene_type:complete
MADKYINIQFPFKDSTEGFLVELTKDDNRAIKSDLMHLILTKQGERLYSPEFGTNLIRFIFEPNDGITQSEITSEIKQTVKRYIPNLQINKVETTYSDENEYTAKVRIDFTITEDVFETTDFVIINL